MTSHYMECTVKSPFKDVFRALGDYFGNVFAREFRANGERVIGVVLGEEYFLRVNSDVAILIILQEQSPDETALQIISCAGGYGMVELSYGAHSAYVHKVKDVLSEDGFRIENEKEVSNFSHRV